MSNKPDWLSRLDWHMNTFEVFVLNACLGINGDKCNTFALEHTTINSLKLDNTFTIVRFQMFALSVR